SVVVIWIHRVREHPRRVYALSRPRTPQFSALLCPPACFADRHLDAVDRAVLAGLQDDQLGGPARRFWIRQPDSHPFFGFSRRVPWGPLQPSPGRNLDANRVLDPGVRARAPDTARSRA